MGSDADHVPHTSPRPFVVVQVGDDISQRFAAGTKAGYAIERINQKRADEKRNYLYIESVKEDEEPVEFGPDAELIYYGEGWTLRAVQGVSHIKLSTLELDKLGPKGTNGPLQERFRFQRMPGFHTKMDLLKEIWAIGSDPDVDCGTSRDGRLTEFNPADSGGLLPDYKPAENRVLQEFNPADFYPGGVLPDCKPPENRLIYYGNLVCVVSVLFLFGGILVLLLESRFFMVGTEEQL